MPAATLNHGDPHTFHGLDGWVSLEVSPVLADDSAGTIAQAADLHARAKLSNLLIKIPGTPAGLVASEASSR